MSRDTLMRYVSALVIALAVLLAGGCHRSQARPASGAPHVRIEGARIMEADPEQHIEQGPVGPAESAPAAEPPASPGDAKTEPPPIAEGVRITLDLVDARATEVLRGLAYQGGVDLVLAGGTDRRVTVRLQDAPWLEAFGAVLSGANLVSEWQGRRVRVLSPDQLKTEREAADRLEHQRLQTEVIALQNLFAKDAASTLAAVLSEAGRIGVDEEQNSLIVTDMAPRIAAIRAALKDLDRTPVQVMIEAILVDVTLSDELHYGFNWTVLKNAGNTVTVKQALRADVGTDATLNPGAAVTFELLASPWSITGIFDLLQTMDNVKVLANPRVLAVNNRQAQIEIIEEIPYQVLTQTSAGGQIGTTSFKEVGIKLGVLPRVAADGTVHVKLSAEESSPTTSTVNQIPVVQTRRGDTTMIVPDGRIVALGGLRRHTRTTNEDKVPVLGDLKGVGFLFRRVETVDAETELVVFIRPKIVRVKQPLTVREKTLAGAINHPDRRPQAIRTDPLRLHVQEEDARTRQIP